ncbi:hypothetical protein A3B42_00875 [Candidatus Daviesbacteria bacterium RIFCSPLOWO2_01_FULL_38_10]|nr:MAG: Transcriptional regulator, AbrB family [Candidatus Daviesbacteria bacterium GW2011_GWA2_38_17]OGE26058.1 MAG: hypothetical protein A3D02_03450 [Candidatus Daviesbacteria bacterium RIFCSPHIGHO2_02_FULL_39_41]OGE38317.1 MAG: hypothetical protein A3B42_00875 [Candidatus Daviesbacteria bacterium RIFCSPLOWO2_01_FULL_38_10]OGE44870.1 MAG: hypothetical protein A3E67_00480 [Candidatus Daviesbacteria bacterium RIFCSPHIGHO2_12_FULL_38_25]OGE68077.1 MAG: hypothetical protein A3H81_03720 [Candidatu
MTYLVSITSQGQISIPVRFRRELELEKTKRAFISKEDNKLIVEPVKNLLELGGSLKTNKKPLSNKELDEVVALAVAEEYARKLK